VVPNKKKIFFKPQINIKRVKKMGAYQEALLDRTKGRLEAKAKTCQGIFFSNRE
jgi:hypothetical protein